MPSPSLRVAFRCLWLALLLAQAHDALARAATAAPSQVAGAQVAAAQVAHSETLVAREPLAQYPGSPFEDRRGQLWFGTVLEGVLRFDGSEFVSFTERDGLGSNATRDIVEDGDGTLWFATTGGLTRYDGTSFITLTKYAAREGRTQGPGFSGRGFHRDIWDILIDRRGQLWIAAMDGVYRLDGDTLKPIDLPVLDTPHEFEFTARMVYTVFEDRDGVLWFGTDGAGVVRDDGAQQTVYTTRDGLAGDHVASIVQDRRGDLWFGTSGGGVSHFDGETFTTHLRTEEFHDHGVGWGRYLDILADSAGHLWFGVSGPGGGVHRYDGTSFRHFSVADGLGDGGVFSLSEDRSGQIWIGSTSGVFRFDGQRFEHFGKGSRAPLGLDDTRELLGAYQREVLSSFIDLDKPSVLHTLGERRPTEPLLQLFRARDPVVAKLGGPFWGLVCDAVDGEAFVEPLIERLAAADPRERSFACEALAQLGVGPGAPARRAIPELLALLDDSEPVPGYSGPPPVAAFAATALAAMGRDDGLGVLLAAADDQPHWHLSYGRTLVALSGEDFGDDLQAWKDWYAER